MSNKWKPSNRKRKPFEYTKKFRKLITNIDKSLEPGNLVKMRQCGIVLLYIGNDKSKKTWHRKYYFLSNGKINVYKRDFLYNFEVLNESR